MTTLLGSKVYQSSCSIELLINDRHTTLLRILEPFSSCPYCLLRTDAFRIPDSRLSPYDLHVRSPNRPAFQRLCDALCLFRTSRLFGLFTTFCFVLIMVGTTCCQEAYGHVLPALVSFDMRLTLRLCELPQSLGIRILPSFGGDSFIGCRHHPTRFSATSALTRNYLGPRRIW